MEPPRVTSVGELIAAIPYMVGYQPAEPSFSVVAIGRDDGTVVFTAVSRINGEESPATATQAFFDELGAAVNRSDQSIGSLVVTFHGDPAAMDAEGLTQQAFDSFDRVERIALANAYEGAYRVIGPDDEGWSSPEPVPRPPMIPGVGMEPAASPEEFYGRTDPYPEPRFADVDEVTRNQLDRMPPSLRVEVANRTLDRIADAPDPHSMSVLAHLAGDPTVQDYLLMHASEDRMRAQALLEVYKSSPEHHRSLLAGLAGGSMFLAGDATYGVQRILSVASPDPQSLRGLMLQAMNLGVNGSRVQQELRRGTTPDRLVQADRDWEQRGGLHLSEEKVQARTADVHRHPSTSMAPRERRGLTP